MDGFTIATFVALIVCAALGLTLGFLAFFWSSEKSHGTRFVMVAAGLLGPTLYVGYLLTAGYLRNVQAYRRGEAACRDGSCTVQLSHDYQLSYFDEVPWLARVLRAAPWATQDSNPPPPIDRVHAMTLDQDRALIACGSTDSASDQPDRFFALDLRTGKAREFDSEAALRRATGFAGNFLRTDEFLADREARERWPLFWPATVAAPFAMLGLIVMMRKLSVGRH